MSRRGQRTPVPHHATGRRYRSLTVVAVLPLIAVVSGTVAWSRITRSPLAFVRVNQVGYLSGQTKQAFLLANRSESGATFRVTDANTSATVYSAPVGNRIRAWGRFAWVYLLDFSSVSTPGAYFVTVTGHVPAASPAFAIGSGAQLYTDLLANARAFYLAQRDGPNVDSSVMNRQPSHLADEQASVYASPSYGRGGLRGTLIRTGGPLDVSGGWFDAGDYLKFVETASYTDLVMLLGVRDYPALLSGGSADFATEARFGLDWLNKMWDDASGTLYYQVGIGDGNGSSILGDHDVWRLPQADDALAVAPGDPEYFVKYRPVFSAGAAGGPLSPNLAGRLAAAFGLCFQVYQTSDPTYAAQCLHAGEHVFDQAQTGSVGQLVTADPYDDYPETSWRDDLELGATELYFATAAGNLPPGLPHTDPTYYLQQAAGWAQAYISGPDDGTDALNLYDVSGLAHAELVRAITQAGHPAGLAVTTADLLADLQGQLDAGVKQATKDPFGLGFAYGSGDAVPHALGYAVEAMLWDDLTGNRTYADFGAHQLDWVLGANAWGSSFVVGAGFTFPHCMQHQVANLAGSLDGTPPIILGATVDGPSWVRDFLRLGLPTGARACPPDGSDPFRIFSGHHSRYWDNAVAWPSVEPADDYTALTILAFARETTLQ